jgi:EAL domain-containing protein (putative c-di-GMP-specific phosphodiesterase class I)/uncharacterized membrane protein YeaQ/YmgE (transglycosylase-associated protein family)
VAIGPANFLPAAKRLDLLTAIDQWVMGKIVDLLVDKFARCNRPEGPYISVNLGAKSLADPIFREWLIERLDEMPQICRVLWVELTEPDELQGAPVELEFFADLQARGIRLYLDDFGTGCNSFDILTRIQVDGIKIDRSVMVGIVTDPIDQALIFAALSIVNKFGIDLVAEGIEDPETLEFLIELGVSKFQGFLFHKPEPAEMALWLLNGARCTNANCPLRRSEAQLNHTNIRKYRMMSNESLLVFLIVGALAGWLAGQVVRGGGFGLIGDIVVGVIGAFIAGWLFPRLGFSLGTGIVRAIVNATIGSILLLLLVRLIRRA